MGEKYRNIESYTNRFKHKKKIILGGHMLDTMSGATCTIG